MSPRRWWQSDPTGLTRWQRNPLGVVQIVLLGVLGALALLAGCSVDDPCSTPEDQQVTTSTATSSTLPTTTAAILVATLALPVPACADDGTEPSTSAPSLPGWGEKCGPGDELAPLDTEFCAGLICTVSHPGGTDDVTGYGVCVEKCEYKPTEFMNPPTCADKTGLGTQCSVYGECQYLCESVSDCPTADVEWDCLFGFCRFKEL